MKDKVKQILNIVLPYIKNKQAQATKFIKNTKDFLINKLTQFKYLITGKLIECKVFIVKKIKAFIDKLFDLIGFLVNQVISLIKYVIDLLKRIGNFIVCLFNTLAEKFKQLVNFIKNQMIALFRFIGKMICDLYELIKQALKFLIKKIIELVNWLWVNKFIPIGRELKTYYLPLIAQNLKNLCSQDPDKKALSVVEWARLITVMMIIIAVILLVGYEHDIKPKPKSELGINKVNFNHYSRKFAQNIENYYPLKVGNSWVYSWKYYPNEQDDTISVNTIIFPRSMVDEKMHVWVIEAENHELKDHTEIYKVVKKINDKFYIDISTTDPLAVKRDGRYSNVQNQLDWQEITVKNNTFKVLKEQIIFDYDYFNRITNFPPELYEFFSESYDYRTQLIINPHNRLKNKVSTEIYNQEAVKYQIKIISDSEKVSVPTGTFINCLHVAEKYTLYDRKLKTHRTIENHMFYVPGIGKIKEYQQYPTGEKSYEMELIKFRIVLIEPKTN